MNLNKKIGFLLDKGLNPKFISSLNENKINFLFETMSKKENKEQVTQVPSKPSFKVGDKGGTLPPNDKGYAIKKNTDNTVTATPMESEIKEDNIKEKFESKAQQGLFWARCNKCKSEDCKWCKMAKEFSKSTSKKHPEKTVKYKKKETNEEFTMANYFDKLTSTYTNNVKNKLTKEEILNKHLTTLVENNLRPTMKKRDLLKLIESKIKRKKGLNEDFYYGSELGESSYGEPMTLDPMTTFDTETDIETKRELSKVAEVEDCETGQTFYIKPKKSTSPSDIYMISDGGSNYCVQVIKMVKKEPSDFRIIESYSECNDCIIDLKLNKKEGGGKSQFGVETSYGTDTSSDSGPRIKKFGKFTPDVDKHSTIDPDTLRLPKAGRENTSKFTASFRRNLDKINEILNRRNNI
jgi:hypothetical protein